MGAFAEGLSHLPPAQEPERSLRERLVSLRSFLVLILNTADPAARTALIAQALDHVLGILAFIEDPEINAAGGGALTGLDAIRVFYDRIVALTKGLMERPVASSEASLPSPAVFMEPVLSQAKGAELYDIRRNSHYDILPSPGIGTVDPNVDRSQPMEELSPTVPGATLSQVTPPSYPLPGTLASFGAEAGKLDLSTMIQTNANSLSTTLTSLSALATELAKASSGLAGDAQKEVLAQAGKIGEQIDSIVESSLGDMARLAQSMGRQTPPSAPPPAPASDPSKGTALNEEARTEAEKMSPERKERRKRTLGIPTPAPDKLNYQFQLLFEDENGAAYDFGEARIRATFFELGADVPLNGGTPIGFDGGSYFLPETYLLTPGRKATLGVFVRFGAMSEIGDNVVIVLPSSPDVALSFRMRTRTETLESEDVKTAVNTVVENSGLKLSAQAALKAALQQVLTLGLELPFKVLDVGVDASASGSTTGSGDAGGNIAGEYVTGTTTTTGGNTSTTTKRTYQVTIPLFAWDVTVYEQLLLLLILLHQYRRSIQPVIKRYSRRSKASVRLTQEERTALTEVIGNGKAAARKMNMRTSCSSPMPADRTGDAQSADAFDGSARTWAPRSAHRRHRHLRREAKAWADRRNASRAVVDWQFTADNACTKLKRLYPQGLRRNGEPGAAAAGFRRQFITRRPKPRHRAPARSLRTGRGFPELRPRARGAGHSPLSVSARLGEAAGVGSVGRGKRAMYGAGRLLAPREGVARALLGRLLRRGARGRGVQQELLEDYRAPSGPDLAPGARIDPGAGHASPLRSRPAWISSAIGLNTV